MKNHPTEGHIVYNDNRYWLYDYREMQPMDYPVRDDYAIVDKLESGSPVPTGYLLVDGSGSVIKELPGVPVFFANGYITVDRGTGNSLAKSSINLYQIFDGTTGEPISDTYYMNAKFFADGYCPVQNGFGKWGYINEQGEPVTEFCFDDASALYEGKAYVSHNGKYGILNLAESLNKRAEVTCVKCFGEELEEQENYKYRKVTYRINKEKVRRYENAGYNNKSGESLLKDTFIRSESVPEKEADGVTWCPVSPSGYIPNKDGDTLTEMDIQFTPDGMTMVESHD